MSSGKILILGGSGILSTAVCEQALKKNYDVTCITRGNRDFSVPNGAKIVHGDVHHLETLIDKIENKYDAVMDFLTFNVSQLENKLKFLACRCRQYFFVSSATAYGTAGGITTEESKLGNEFWDYGNNKALCENYLKNYAQGCNDEFYYTIIRPYVTYGNTRLPFAIVPRRGGMFWSLANRILCKKPILIWDDGRAVCTLTHSSDFAVGFIGLVGNEKSYNEAFHITSDERLTWSDVLEQTGNALGIKPEVFSAKTEEIVKLLPEYKGVLLGDKARDQLFDNTKIKTAVPEFRNFIPFSEGIRKTIKYFQANSRERKIDYEWDGRIDNAIKKLSARKGISINMSTLHFASSEKQSHINDRLKYYSGKFFIPMLLLCILRKLKINLQKICKKSAKNLQKICKKSAKNLQKICK